MLAILSLPAAAQQRGIAGINGQVTDKQQAVIPGVRVVLSQIATRQQREAATNQDSPPTARRRVQWMRHQGERLVEWTARYEPGHFQSRISGMSSPWRRM